MDPRALADLSAALERREWEAADRATRDVLLQAVGREPEAGLFFPADIARLPSALLLDVDSLWRDNSGGALGFGVQTRLWIELGGAAAVFAFEAMSADERKAVASVEKLFARRVGWAAEGKWQGASYVADATRARGALPYLPLVCSYGYGLVGFNLAALAARFA